MHTGWTYRAMTLKHLAAALRHVELGQKLVIEQRARVDRARRQSLDVTAHATTLALLEEIQALHVADRDRLRAELELLDRGATDQARGNEAPRRLKAPKCASLHSPRFEPPTSGR